MPVRHINLLPPERRNNMRQGILLGAASELIKLGLVLVIILTVAGVATGVGLILTGSRAEKDADNQLGETLTSYRDLRDRIGDKNRLFDSVLELGNGRVVWASRIQDVLAAIPPGIEIQNLGVELTDEKAIIYLSGVASARSSVVVLEDNLEKMTWIEHLQAPRSNLLAPAGAPYSFEITVDQSADI